MRQFDFLKRVSGRGIFCMLLVAGMHQANGQGIAMNTTGAAANSSAMLDVSSTTQGVLIPRMTSAQRTAISSPATGLLVYQTDGTAGFYFYNGSAWTSLNSAGGTAGGDLTGSYPNPTISSGASTGNNIITAINASGGGLSGTELATNSVSVNAMSATGTRNSTTYLRGDNTWATVSGGSGTVTSVSSGNLSPVFTSSVATNTTTPSITYTMTPSAAYAVLTNSTNALGTPSYGKVVPNALFATSGTPSGTTYYRGDGSWQTPSATAPNPNVTSTASASYTALSTDNYIVYNGSGTSFTVTLPTTAAATTGHIYYIKYNTTASGTSLHLIITPQSSDAVMIQSTGSGGPYGYNSNGTSVDIYAAGNFTGVGLIADATNHQWNILYVTY